MEDRDRLGQRQGQVEVQRALPGLAGGFDPQLVLALGGGVRLGGQQAGVEVACKARATGEPESLRCSDLASERPVALTRRLTAP